MLSSFTNKYFKSKLIGLKYNVIKTLSLVQNFQISKYLIKTSNLPRYTLRLIVGKILFIKLHLILFFLFPIIILGVTCWRDLVVSRRQVGSSGSWPSYCSCAGSLCTSVYGRGQNLQERLVFTQ